MVQRLRFKWLVRCDDNNIVVMSRVLEQLDGVRDRDELRCEHAQLGTELFDCTRVGHCS